MLRLLVHIEQKFFPVLREAVERYKSEAPVFKKEHIVNEKGSATNIGFQKNITINFDG